MPRTRRRRVGQRQQAADARQTSILLDGTNLPSPTHMEIRVSQIGGVTEASRSPEMERSVSRFGVLQPIIVVESDGMPDLYDIVDGRRRIAAVQANGGAVVDAMVYPRNTPISIISGMLLTANLQRSENLMPQVEAVAQLVNAGGTETAVAFALGISALRVRRLSAIAFGSPIEVREGLARGLITERTALLMQQASVGARLQFSNSLSLGRRITLQEVSQVVAAETNANLSQQIEIAPEAIRPTRTSQVSVEENPDGTRRVLVLGQEYVPVNNLEELVASRTTTISDLEFEGTWASVSRLLQAAFTAVPIGMTPDQEAVFTQLDQLVRLVLPLALTELREPPRPEVQYATSNL